MPKSLTIVPSHFTGHFGDRYFRFFKNKFMPNLYIISGANGSGKTTTAKQLLPQFLDVYEYLNADEMAAGLSPFSPESVAIQAGKIMLQRLDYFVEHQIDFAFKTTLSGLNYIRFLTRVTTNFRTYAHKI